MFMPVRRKKPGQGFSPQGKFPPQRFPYKYAYGSAGRFAGGIERKKGAGGIKTPPDQVHLGRSSAPVAALKDGKILYNYHSGVCYTIRKG
jgi:hypothetical protein